MCVQQPYETYIQMFVCCYRMDCEVRVWQECCLPFEKSLYVGA